MAQDDGPFTLTSSLVDNHFSSIFPGGMAE